jgi:NADPH:quinone reductase-like Zn-dependent oxidoreductase
MAIDMKMRHKIVSAVFGLLVVGGLTGALVLSHNSACGSATAPSAGVPTMKAVVQRCYGSADVVKLEDTARPAAADHRVVVKVRAASINPLDWHYLHGTPYVLRLQAGLGAPTDPRMGVDFAGTVESVGAGVTSVRPGDEIFGGADGALAEYVSVSDTVSWTLRPANVSAEQAAAVPIAGLTALQALRDYGKLRRGQKVLINGASGGVGTFAVQIAKALGAEVTAVCSTGNLAMVRALGADHVIDYTAEDFTQRPQRYDLILDAVANRSLSDLRRVMTSAGVAVIVGGGGVDSGHWIGPLITPIKTLLYSRFVSQRFVFFIARLNSADLAMLGQLMESGQLKSVIDRRYTLATAAAAIRYLEEGHARGKVVLNVN